MRVVVNCRTGQRQWQKNCSTSKMYLGRTNYPRPNVTLKRCQLLLQAIQCAPRKPDMFFSCNRIKSFWKSRQRWRKPIFWHLSAINPCEKIASDQKLHHNSLLYTLPIFLNISSDTHHVEAGRKRYILDNAKNSPENSSFWTKIFGHFFVKNQKTIGQK